MQHDYFMAPSATVGFCFPFAAKWVSGARSMARDAHPTMGFIFHVALSALLHSWRFVFLHGGDGPARADFGDRSRAGFVTGGVSGLL